MEKPCHGESTVTSVSLSLSLSLVSLSVLPSKLVHHDVLEVTIGCSGDPPRTWPHRTTLQSVRANSALFSRRFREGISFPNFLERSTLKLPLLKLCDVHLALQNRALSKVEKRAKRRREKD